MLNVADVHYQYNEKPLLHSLNFQVVPGEIFHIQGMNGQGKTTLLKLLAGLLKPTSGKIQWQAHNIEDIWPYYCQQRFYLGHELALKENFSLYENVKFNFLFTYDKNSIQLNINGLNLISYQHIKIYELSPGIRKKTSLLRLCNNQFKLWLLDEPFNTLDLDGQQWLKNQLYSFIDTGGMIVMASHLNPNVAVNHTINLDQYNEQSTNNF